MQDQMVADHPFWLELNRLTQIVDNMWGVVTLNPQPTQLNREAYTTHGLSALLANLNMVEAQTGTVCSLHKGAAAVQVFAYASIFVAFAGEKGRGYLYSSQILDLALDNYRGATRNTHYRLHLLCFLKNLAFCQKKRFPTAANPLTTSTLLGSRDLPPAPVNATFSTTTTTTTLTWKQHPQSALDWWLTLWAPREAEEAAIA
jgi:hypothetical protein